MTLLIEEIVNEIFFIFQEKQIIFLKIDRVTDHRTPPYVSNINVLHILTKFVLTLFRPEDPFVEESRSFSHLLSHTLLIRYDGKNSTTRIWQGTLQNSCMEYSGDLHEKREEAFQITISFFFFLPLARHPLPLPSMSRKFLFFFLFLSCSDMHARGHAPKHTSRLSHKRTCKQRTDGHTHIRTRTHVSLDKSMYRDCMNWRINDNLLH